jgi:hypothetical protein
VAAVDHAGVELLEGGIRPPPWRRHWARLPRVVRGLAAALAVVLVVGAGALWLRDEAAERALSRQVDLSASLGVWSTSTAPNGGRISYFVTVRNLGPRALSVTAVEGTAGGVRLRMRGDPSLPLAAGADVGIPVSVLLSCAGPVEDDALTAQVGVRRQDGGTTTRRVPLESASLVLDLAASLCAFQPDLRDRELSGPVLDLGG